jgi:acyl dehydratase
MPKATYPQELKDPVKYNKRLAEWIDECNNRVGEIKPWDMNEDHTWRHTNRVATEDLIRHYCEAYGEINPIFCSMDYARKTCHGGVIAPPTFITCITPSAIGHEPDDVPCVGFNAGADYYFYKVVHAGDEFHGYDTFLGWVEKKRDQDLPRMWIGNIRRTYINQREEIVAQIEGSELRFGLPPTEKGLLYGATSKNIQKYDTWKYSDDDLEKITQTYEQMEKDRRGNKVRWWEDVNVGDDIGTILQGPYDLMDVMAMMGVQSYLSLAFGIKWKRIWNHTRFTLDQNNQSTWEPHLRDHENLGYIFVQSAQLEAGVNHLICNWMGDDGFLKKLSCQSRRMFPVGDCNWITGKIVKKYIQEDEHLVDLELESKTQRGIMHMPATATVSLLNRAQLSKAIT